MQSIFDVVAIPVEARFIVVVGNSWKSDGAISGLQGGWGRNTQRQVFECP
jgi:hypothetical protein